MTKFQRHVFLGHSWTSDTDLKLAGQQNSYSLCCASGRSWPRPSMLTWTSSMAAAWRAKWTWCDPYGEKKYEIMSRLTNAAATGHNHTEEWTDFLRLAKQRCFRNLNRTKMEMTVPHDGATEQSPISPISVQFGWKKHHFLQGFLNHFVLAKDAVLDSWDTLILQKVHAASWCSRHRHTVVSAMSTQSGWPQWVSRGCEFCGTLPFQHCLQHSLQHGFPVKFNINWYIPVVFLHRKHQKDFAYLSKLRVSFEAATSCASFPPALLGFKQSNS